MRVRLRLWGRRRQRKMSAIESLMFDEAYASAKTPEAKASLLQVRQSLRGVLGLTKPGNVSSSRNAHSSNRKE